MNSISESLNLFKYLLEIISDLLGNLSNNVAPSV